MNVKRYSKGSINRPAFKSPLAKEEDIPVVANADNIATTGAGCSDFVGGSVFDFNTEQRGVPVRFNPVDTNKYDPIQDYRQKISLKNEPYDIKTTKYLTEQNTPTRQNIDTYIKRGQDRMKNISAKVKAFLAQSSRNDRLEMLENHSVEGLVRTKKLFPKTAGTVQPYIWSVIDYGNHCIYFLAIEDESGKYYLFSKRPDSRSFKQSIYTHTKKTIDFDRFVSSLDMDASKLKPGNTDNKMRYLNIFDNEKQFYSNKYVHDAFLDAKEDDFIERSDVIDVGDSIKAICGVDPKVDVNVDGVFAQKFSEYLKKEEIVDQSDPNKKNLVMQQQMENNQNNLDLQEQEISKQN